MHPNAQHPQRNAADPQQVKHAGRKDRDRVARLKAQYRAVMDTVAGRAVMWDLLSRAGVGRSVWHPSAMIHYNAGRQDFGHELASELIAADDGLYLLMEQEARLTAKRDDVERAAIQTPSATEGKDDDNGR